MTRVNKLATHNPTLKVGAGGNYYVFCIIKDPLVKICIAIEKSINSIYYHDRHHCWVIRIKSKQHKKQLIDNWRMV